MKSKVLLFCLIGCLFGTPLAQTPPKAYPLQMNFDSKTPMDPTWSLIANEASKVRVFIGGENHTEVDFNSLMEYGFMNRLHKFAGYSHYVIELSPARAHYLNRYIRHSDTHARDALKGVSSLKYMNLFENLHRWNQLLDSQDRIQVHGVDVERFYDLSFERLAEPLRKGLAINRCSDSILADVLAIVSYANRRFEDRLKQYNRKLGSVNMEISEDNEEFLNSHFFYRFDYQDYAERIQAQLTHYKNWLTLDDYKEFTAALEGVQECNKWDDDSESASRFHWRETVMYQRFASALNQHPNGKFFGQFGRCHISETQSDIDCGWYSYESVVNRLIAYHFKSRDSVITVGYFYQDKNPSVSAQIISNQSQLTRELKPLLQPYFTGMRLYDLNSSDSDLRELRKKYRFILVNNEKNASLSTEKPTGDFGDASLKDRWPLSLSIPYFGLAYWSIDNPGMKAHFQSQGASFKNPALFGLQHQINVNYGPFTLGISGYYSINVDNDLNFASFTDSAGTAFANFWGVDLLAGLHWQKGAWILDITGRFGPSRLQYTYKQELNLATSVLPVNGLKIHNQSWNTGFSANLFYRFAQEAGVGIQGNTYYNVGNGNWVYSGSNQLYQRLPLSSGLQAWSLTAQVSLFFSK